MINRVVFLFAMIALLAVDSQAATTNVSWDHPAKEENVVFVQQPSNSNISWTDVSVTKKKEVFAADLDGSSSLDDMIKRHEYLADDMLTDSAIGEEIKKKTVDDVAKEAFEDPDAEKTVDDVVEQENIKNDFSDRPKTNEAAARQQAQEDADREAELLAKAAKEKDAVPDVFDESHLLSDRAKSRSEVKRDKHEFSFDYEMYYYRYTEDVVSVKLSGWWKAYDAAYTYRPEEGDLLYFNWLSLYSVEARIADADLDYSSGDTGTDEDEPNSMYEARVLVGRDFRPVPKVMVTPYGGFGYRYLFHDSGGRQTTTGHYTYDRKSHYFYLPFGLKGTYQVNKNWRIVGTGEFDFFLTGWQKSYLSDVPGEFDVRNDQHNGFGLRSSVKFIRTLPLVSVSLEPFVRYWHIADSEVVDGLVEPDNETVEVGIKAGAQF